MNTFKRIPVDLVVVDSGPLISLALAGEIDLLKSFRRPIRILDVVKEECSRFRDKPGANELASWFAANENSQYRTVQTPGHLQRYRDAEAMEDTGSTDRPSEGIGDEAITWYITKVAKIEKGNGVVLVLLEAAAFGDGVLLPQAPEVTALSTRAFLRTLQNYGLIASADEIIKRVSDNSAGTARVR
ncbi:hypothetical protein ACVIGB_000019 [Bradyrhizobium sp. USDA 4341]